METTNIRITENEYALLEAIAISDYHDGRDLEGSHTWTDCVLDDFRAFTGLKKQAISGVFSSAVQKGLIVVQKGYAKNEDTVAMTALGVQAYNEKKGNKTDSDVNVYVESVEKDIAQHTEKVKTATERIAADPINSFNNQAEVLYKNAVLAKIKILLLARTKDVKNVHDLVEALYEYKKIIRNKLIDVNLGGAFVQPLASTTVIWEMRAYQVLNEYIDDIITALDTKK